MKNKMKKIILLGLLIFSTQSFSQTCDHKEQKCGNCEKKIIKEIEIKEVEKIVYVDKIVKPELNEMIKKTEEKLEKYDQKLEEYLQYDAINKKLEKEKTKLGITLQSLQSKETELTDQIRKLKKTISTNTIEKEKEKENIRKAINSIIQQKSGKSSGEVAVIIKEMAKKYTDIDKKDLKDYIQMNEKFVAAKDLLNKPYNKDNIKNNKNNLISLVINNKFSGLFKEKGEIINLLKGYGDMCSTLAKELKDFKDLNASRDQIKKQLKKLQKENIYRGYPYLVTIIEQKLNNKKTSTFGCN